MTNAESKRYNWLLESIKKDILYYTSASSNSPVPIDLYRIYLDTLSAMKGGFTNG